MSPTFRSVCNVAHRCVQVDEIRSESDDLLRRQHSIDVITSVLSLMKCGPEASTQKQQFEQVLHFICGGAPEHCDANGNEIGSEEKLPA